MGLVFAGNSGSAGVVFAGIREHLDCGASVCWEQLIYSSGELVFARNSGSWASVYWEQLVCVASDCWEQLVCGASVCWEQWICEASVC